MALTATAGDFSYTVNPAEGEVDILQLITVTFPNADEIEINSRDALTITRDGQVVRGVEVMVDNKNELVFMLGAEQTQAAVYHVNIPEWSLSGYGDYNAAADEYGWMDVNREDIVLTYEIKSAQTSDIDWSYMVMPEEGMVDELRDIQIYFPGMTEVEINSRSDISLKRDGQPIDGLSLSFTNVDLNLLDIEPSEALTEAGVYTLEFPAAVLAAYDQLDEEEGYQVFGINEEPIVLTWTIESGVQYDLGLAISTPKPNAAGEISADKSLESIFFYCEEPGLVAAAGSAANVTIREVNGDFTASGHLRKANGINPAYTYFSVAFGKEPTYNGQYEITVDRGAFGTAAWGENPEYGRTNDEIVLTFTLIDGADRDIYTIEPLSVSPEAGVYGSGAELGTFTVCFPEGVTATEDARAGLVGMGTVIYGEMADFTATDNGFEVTFATLPVEDGEYMFNVNPGAFTDGTRYNVPITLNYTISINSGVVTVVRDGASKVFDLNGRSVGSDVNALPAGIYVIDGKKVVVK